MKLSPTIQDALSALHSARGFAAMAKQAATATTPEAIRKHANIIVKTAPAAHAETLRLKFRQLGVLV